MSKELIHNLRTAMNNETQYMSEAADALESQAREIEELKKFHDLDMKQIDYLLVERNELRAALVVAVDALNEAERTTRQLEELGRMAGASDADLLIGVETVFSKALTRCKEVLGNG
jgi:hypothetical protein